MSKLVRLSVPKVTASAANLCLALAANKISDRINDRWSMPIVFVIAIGLIPLVVDDSTSDGEGRSSDLRKESQYLPVQSE